MRPTFFTLVAAGASFFLSFSMAVADDTDTTKAKAAEVLKRVTYDIKYLASDELGGRKPGTEGIEQAAKHIEDVFKALGLKTLENGTYRQDFQVREGRTIDKDVASMKLVGAGAKEMTMDLVLGEDFMAQATRKKIELDAELVFVGYGINAEEDLNFNEYRDIDVAGKVVVLIRREPQQNDEDSVFDGTDVSRHSYIRAKTRAAKDAGALGIIMVNDGVNASNDEKDVLEDATRFSTTFPFIQIKRRVLDDLLANSPLTNADGKKISKLADVESLIDETLSPISQPLKGWKVTCTSIGKEKMATTSNIVGIIEGEGPHADETVIIGGHYDHLGMGGMGSRTNRREIHNGADDNATGTAAVMELARRYAKRGKKPSRRLVFIAFSAEEMGLLGAKYYVEDDPIYELGKTAAMVNFDMIGWLRDDKVTIYNANSATEFEQLLDRANDGMDMDVVKSAGFGGSDHLPFYQKEIPVMFIHTGLTSTYHTPEDDFETIDCAGAVKVINYSEKVVDEILALETKPTFQSNASNRRSRIRLGVSLDDEVENGVKITRILEGSIAEKYGFQVDDVITAIGVDKTDKRRRVNQLIRSNAGKTVMFKLLRGTEQVETLVELKKVEAKKEEGETENKG